MGFEETSLNFSHWNIQGLSVSEDYFKTPIEVLEVDVLVHSD